jgi:hypothetical protein
MMELTWAMLEEDEIIWMVHWWVLWHSGHELFYLISHKKGVVDLVDRNSNMVSWARRGSPIAKIKFIDFPSSKLIHCNAALHPKYNVQAILLLLRGCSRSTDTWFITTREQPQAISRVQIGSTSRSAISHSRLVERQVSRKTPKVGGPVSGRQPHVLSF